MGVNTTDDAKGLGFGMFPLYEQSLIVFGIIVHPIIIPMKDC